MRYFTSDTHFFHRNVIEYCSRPFRDVFEMNEALIERWNSVVGVDDEVVHVGDVFMGPSGKWKGVFERLNGRIVLIRGNHDYKRNVILNLGFAEIHKTLEMEIEGKRVLLRHIPDYERAVEYDFHICGHVHEKWKVRGNIINVGVDVWDYYPRTWSELMKGFEYES